MVSDYDGMDLTVNIVGGFNTMLSFLHNLRTPLYITLSCRIIRCHKGWTHLSAGCGAEAIKIQQRSRIILVNPHHIPKR